MHFTPVIRLRECIRLFFVSFPSVTLPEEEETVRTMKNSTPSKPANRRHSECSWFPEFCFQSSPFLFIVTRFCAGTHNTCYLAQALDALLASVENLQNREQYVILLQLLNFFKAVNETVIIRGKFMTQCCLVREYKGASCY